jgi:acyl-CoA thioesterase I
VADAPYFMHGRWERDARQAADLLRRSAAERDLRPVALHEALRAQGWRAMSTQYAADWFHPNDRGHRVWADAFWQQMADDTDLVRRRP